MATGQFASCSSVVTAALFNKGAGKKERHDTHSRHHVMLLALPHCSFLPYALLLKQVADFKIYVILEHCSPINSETVFEVGSIAKQFTGMSIALLEEDGILSISDRLHKYIPKFSGHAQGITLANLLFHTGGIRNYTVLAYYMMGYHESDAITKEEIINLLIRLRSTNFKPGE